MEKQKLIFPFFFYWTTQASVESKISAYSLLVFERSSLFHFTCIFVVGSGMGMGVTVTFSGASF